MDLKLVMGMTGFSDRIVRDTILSLNHRGVPIGSLKHNKIHGYRFPLDEEQKFEGVKANKAQAQTLLKKIEKIENSDIGEVLAEMREFAGGFNV